MGAGALFIQSRIWAKRKRAIGSIRTCSGASKSKEWIKCGGADITYVRLRQGFVYLVAVMDWYSRYVLAWEVSVSLESSFCVSALECALRQAQPDIFNSDQGAQFTREAFTGRLLQQGIQISMDGRGRALDNIFVERLWRSVKYEEIGSCAKRVHEVW
jgi:transposase InsO family protein